MRAGTRPAPQSPRPFARLLLAHSLRSFRLPTQRGHPATPRSFIKNTSAREFGKAKLGSSHSERTTPKLISLLKKVTFLMINVEFL